MRHSSVQIRGEAPDYQNYLCSCNNVPEDEVRRMDLDDIVLVVDAQMPVRAKRIKYYEDRFFKGIFDKQSGDLYQRSLIRTHAPICACRGT